MDLNSYYQDAFLIPGSSPFNAKSRNVFLDIPNFLSVPRGLPVTSHLFLFKKVEGVSFEVPDQNTIIVLGIDKALVGQVAANIRAIKPPEPYKGKGIRYKDEYVRRKAGKAAVTAGA